MKKKSVFPNRTGARTTALLMKQFNKKFQKLFGHDDMGYKIIVDAGLVRKLEKELL
jgi:hypothetical protein